MSVIRAAALSTIIAVVMLVLALNGEHASSASAQSSLDADLQSMVDRAEPGDTITLRPGIYSGPIVIGKPIQIRSEPAGGAVLLNDSDVSALTIEADDVTVSGLVISDESFKEQPTVKVSGHRAIIEDVKISTGADGIAVKDADDGIVRRAEITWIPEGVPMARKGNGIDLFNADRWRMEDNVIRDVHDGIYMEQSDDGHAIGNRIEGSRYGIHCMYTARSIIRKNEGHANVTGAMVMTTRNVEVTDNVFAKQNENVHSQGILLFDAHDSLFEGNVVEGNRAGLYVEESTGNRFIDNRVVYNFVGLQLLNAEKNDFTGNLFQGNVSDAEARGSSDNDISGNYWDGHSGIDADGDGYCDTTYAINPFFQGLTQKRAAFQLLFQSPGMAFLEGLYETHRDDWSTDRKPLMAPAFDEASSGGSDDAQTTLYISLALLALVVMVLYKNRRRMQ